MNNKINFGVSMYCCIYKASEYLYLNDPIAIWLKIIEDFTKFSRKMGFETIELVSTPLIIGDLLLEHSGEIKQIISGFKEVTYHLPSGEINMSALLPRIREVALDEVKKHITLCSTLGINKAVIHPGSFASMPDEYALLGELVTPIVVKNLLEVNKYALEQGITLSLENLHSQEPLFQNPDELALVIKETGLGFCLDSAHSFVCKIDPIRFIGKFINLIGEVHLAGGDWKYPLRHYPVDFRCLKILGALVSIGFQGPVIIEVGSEKDVDKSMTFLEKNGY
jgi:sugar phosphate isomerase/epimerase